MHRRVGGPHSRVVRVLGLRLSALIGLVLACSVTQAQTPTGCTDSYTDNANPKNGLFGDPNNWSNGVPTSSTDAWVNLPGFGSIAVIGVFTIHSLTIGGAPSSSWSLFAIGSAATKTAFTVTGDVHVEEGGGIGFIAADSVNPTISITVGGTMRVDGTLFTNGGFKFKPLTAALKVASCQIYGALSTLQDSTAQLEGIFDLMPGSTASGHGLVRTNPCSVTPTATMHSTLARSTAASVLCPGEGSLGVAPGAYQVGVDIGGILDLSDSTGTRTVDSYSQDSSGTTKLALTGEAISEISATGTAALGGAIEVDESGDSTPQNGDMLPIITAASVTGTFSTLTVLNACLGQIYHLIYTPTGVMLAVGGDCSTPTPSPAPTLTPIATPTLTSSPTAPPLASPTDTPPPTTLPPETLTATQVSTSTLTPEMPPSQTSTDTPTATLQVLSSVTATQTPTNTPTPTHTASLTAIPTTPAVSCAGDCNNNGSVTVDELIKMVNIALGNSPPSACPQGITKTPVTIDEIISAVDNALGGCRR